jgi:anti-anti-sigma factor
MITFEQHHGTPVARIAGDIDMANIGEIEAAIMANVKSDAFGFVVDLTDVTYLDSAGIRMIYKLDERANGRQQQIAVVVPRGAQITRSLEAAGVIGTLRITPTVDEAIDAIRPN